MRLPRRGLYALTQTGDKTLATVLAETAAVLEAGAVMVQYRDKRPREPLLWATALARLCARHQVPLIINDDIELAARAGAAGVHLGQDDGQLSLARQRLGPGTIIGASCYNSVERAVAAVAQGADYVAFGRFFPSASKPLASPATLSTLREARRLLAVPLVAIGGILPTNGGALLAAGADLLAVIGGLYADGDPGRAASAYQALFADG